MEQGCLEAIVEATPDGAFSFPLAVTTQRRPFESRLGLRKE